VVDLAERETVWRGRRAVSFAIGDDVGGIQHLGVFESADRAREVTGEHDLGAEHRLMHALLDEAREVRRSRAWASRRRARSRRSLL